MARIHVVGAGIAGLSAAYFLRRHGFDVCLYEATSRVGGLIGTKKTKYGIAETGAHAFMNSLFLEELCTELGVELTAATPLSRKYRFLEYRLQITRWPLGIRESLRLLMGVALFKFRPPKEFETVADWATRVFGRGAAIKLITKVLQGIYAADASQLSASLIFGRLYRAKVPVKRPQLRGSVAPLGGMQEFTDQLLARFLDMGGTLFQNSEIDEVKVRAWLDRDELVILGVPVWTAAKLLGAEFADIAQDLAAVPPLALEATTIFWDAARTTSLRPGFGILFDRRSPQDPLLGVLQNERIFAQRTWGAGVYSETWITSGSLQPLADAQAKRTSILGPINDALPGVVLDSVEIKWPRSIPLFGKKLEFAFREAYSTKLAARGIYLVGNYTGQIGVAKIVERSYELAQQLSSRRTHDHAQPG